MDWNSIFTTLGSTAIVVAAIGFVAKSFFNHLLSKASAEHSNALQVLSNEKKAALDSELKRRTDAFLLEQKAAFDKQLEIFKADVASSSAKEDRIRDEVVRWANPILSRSKCCETVWIIFLTTTPIRCCRLHLIQIKVQAGLPPMSTSSRVRYSCSASISAGPGYLKKT